MSDISKQTIRAGIKAQYRATKKAQLSTWSQELSNLLEQHRGFQEAKTVLLFHSLPDEPNTHTLCQKWGKKKCLLLPRVEGEKLYLHQYVGEHSLQKGAYGIMEPAGPLFSSLCDIDLAVIPGVAFTQKGCRLGRGGGYYDRLLADPAWKAYTIGYCFPFQILDTLPTEPFDRSVNEVLATKLL